MGGLPGEPIIFEDIDMLVLCHGHQAANPLKSALNGLDLHLHSIGDCLAPRTAEEAVYEGLKISAQI